MDSEQAIRPAESGRRNRFVRMELAGAFGDLGTLIPFVVAYLSVLKMEPFGVLFAFGAAMLVCGFYYRTPMAVQPMKAIGAVAATQAAQTIIITPAAIYGASLITGLIWLVLGLTGAAHRVARLVPQPVVVGIVCSCCSYSAGWSGRFRIPRHCARLPKFRSSSRRRRLP